MSEKLIPFDMAALLSSDEAISIIGRFVFTQKAADRQPVGAKNHDVSRS